MYDPRQGRVVHGGHGRRREEESGERFLDFSANLNPFPPPVPWNPADVPLDAYPDDNYTTLRECISRVSGRNTDEIAIGNGSIELIRVYCQAAIRHGDLYRADGPTFGEYGFSASLAGAMPAPPGRNPAVTFICNPNNPDGRLHTAGTIESILSGCRAAGGMLFLDEAFIELADPRESLAGRNDPSLFVLRSLTKCFAVPGIRFGYGFGDPDLVSRMDAIRPPWSVNAYAEQFAIRAFGQYDLLAASREKIAVEREWLSAALRALGLVPHPSSANFILAGTGSPAAGICRRLSELRILVRDCASFGLPESIRVAVRTREENRLLVEALALCLD